MIPDGDALSYHWFQYPEDRDIEIKTKDRAR